MSFAVTKWDTNVYSDGDTSIIVYAEFECDTVADLPARDYESGYLLQCGSRAHVIADNTDYKMQTSGAWILQRSADVSSIVADISQIETTLESVGDNAAYAKYTIDTYLMPAVKQLINDGAKNRLNLAAAQTTTDNGITFTVNSDFSIEMTGAVSNPANNAWLHVPVTIKAGTYQFTGMTEAGGTTNAYRIELRQTATTGLIAVCDSETGSEVTFNSDTSCYFNIRVNNYDFGQDRSKTVYPMLCNPDLYRMTSDYRPYAPTNRELFDML